MKTLLIVISVLMIAMGVGCAALSNVLTYADLDKAAIRYVGDAGIVDANDYVGWWKRNMVWAAKLIKDVDAAHLTIQEKLRHMMQKDKTQHAIVKNSSIDNYEDAKQREQMLFGEKGILSLGLTMAGFGGFTGLLGLMRKRPQDITKPEMEQALASATGKSASELSTKEKQLVQVVNGLKTFMKEKKNSGEPMDLIVLEALKNHLNQAQDKDTQTAVAVAKTQTT